MIISVTTRRASVLEDELAASFNVERIIRESIPGEASVKASRPVRAVVEILRHGGGLMPRALVGGAFSPGGDGEFFIEVQTSGEITSGQPSCPSQLSRPLVPGLPQEFAQSVVDAFIRRSLPIGRVVVDRAAFDPVESSPLAFELAAELLAIVLYAMSMHRDVEQAARDAIEAWP